MATLREFRQLAQGIAKRIGYDLHRAREQAGNLEPATREQMKYVRGLSTNQQSNARTVFLAVNAYKAPFDPYTKGEAMFIIDYLLRRECFK